jgi:thiosulfate/3-mercaptopyruvate sulfurtransferase
MSHAVTNWKPIHRTLSKGLAALGLLLAMGPALAFGPVISPSDLDGLKASVGKGEIRVLDIRELKGSPEAPNYDAGHIPGSLAAPYSGFRGDKTNPGRPIPEEKLSAVLSALGLTTSTKVVITNRGTDATDFGAAARVYWTLKVAGVKNLAILDGGLKSWTSAGYALSTERPSVVRTKFTVQYDQSAIVDPAEVSKLVASNDSVKPRLIDARPVAFFKGDVRHDAATRYGTLPGAQNLSHDQWFVPKTGRLKSKAEIESVAKAAGLIQDQDTVSFCNTGHWAATNWFILSEVLGQKGAKMFPDSMVAWTKTDQPLQNDPGRVGTLWRDIKRAF